MKRYSAVFVSLYLGLSAANAAESTPASGKDLYEKNCIACHGAEIYTRTDRKVTSRDKLTARVRTCENNLNLQWFDEEVEAVAEYLNKEFYHFP